ncbi:hypothetical protein [Bacillus massilinigeriensis]|uniref:hypothetical protein n=1 Tax=Bacillus massilionigeriensis TaxID=1805475 RepID=UPI00096B0CC5|nr:hypothetical protein [Bacillus massilionigeriensis]
MSLNEFIELKERVAIGEEFSFNYKNDEYWISQNPVFVKIVVAFSLFTSALNIMIYYRASLGGLLMKEQNEFCSFMRREKTLQT